VSPRRHVALVTGASGFIGSHLVEALVPRDWRVRCLVRRTSRLKWIPTDDVTLINGAIDTPGEDLDRAVRGVSVVFHLAGLTSATDDLQYTAVNADGTRNIVDAMQRSAPDALLVFCSSLSAGGPARKRPVNETDEPAPISAYGRSKLAAEEVVTSSGIQYLIARPPAVYGPRDTDILAAFKLALRGVALRVAPAGQRLSMVHAADLARGLVCAAEAEGRGLYYMTDGMIHTYESITEQISRAVGKRVKVIGVPVPVAEMASRADRLRASLLGTKPLLTPDRVLELSQPDWTCDDTRARLDIDYESSITLPDGIAETAAWYRSVGWLPA
jgi:nucleoside-diphosphate-sugar epimerase